MSGEALRFAEGYVQVKPLGPVSIKGLSEPVEVYEVTGATTVRARLQVATARGLTRFVGREAEIDQLRKALDQARGGRGQVVAVVGEPGVGKSRLFYEFVHSHRTHGWLILESGSASYGKATPYLPVIDLLKGYCKIEDRADTRTIRAKVTGTVLTLDETLKETIPAVLALLEALPEDGPFARLDPLLRRQRTLEAIKRLLLRESQVQPLLLVIEDLHWIDAETQAVLDSLIESLPTAAILLLVNYRPEYRHGWGNKTYYRQIRIDPLPPESAEELLQALLGANGALAALKHLLIERTQGNPLFLEESVRTLIETQVLVGERGAYRLAKTLPAIQVPPTVQAVLAARIDRLPPEEKRLLQCAAVIGEEVPFALLQAIAEEPEEALRLRLSHLQAAEFLYEASLFPDLAYTFKHGLTYQVAYQSLLQERRRALHAHIVEVLERLYANRLAEQVDRLAHHAFRGEVWAKAAAYSRQAGAKAAARSAYREAAGCSEQALAALAHLPEARETLEQAIDLRLDLRNFLLALGEYGRILDRLREAEALAESLQDQRRLGRATAYLTHHFRWMGEQGRAVESGERVLAIASGLDDFSLKVLANFYLGQAHHALGNYRRAIEFLKRNVESLQGDLLRERFGLPGLASVHARTWLVWCLAELGEFAEAAARAEEEAMIAEAADHPYSLIHACLAVGAVALWKGDLPKAIPVLERGLGLCRAYNIVRWAPQIASALGSAWALSGRVAEALPLFEQAVAQAGAMGLVLDHSLLVTGVSEPYAQAGRLADAFALAVRARDLSRERKERGQHAWALRLLGEVAGRSAPPSAEAAEEHYRQAMALAEELGMRPLLAHCHLGLGALYRKLGRLEQARAELSTAVKLFRSMEMTFWLPRAESELAKASG
ncbi:MAG: AAA family ATPase [candidate division NC10 bacterium]|nr:AAA family ATPase [candidate division NC10 bacterium]